MSEDIKSFVDSFNKFIENQSQIQGNNEQNIDEIQWAETVNEILGDKPSLVLNKILPEGIDSDKAFEVYKYAVINFIDRVPLILEEKIAKSGNEVQNRILAFIESDIIQKDINASEFSKEDLVKVDLAAAALNSMSIWRNKGLLSNEVYKEKFYKFFDNCLSCNEYLLERAGSILSKTNEYEILIEIMEKINDQNTLVTMMQSLCDMNVKNDEIFNGLKKIFKNLLGEQKLIGAMLLSEYGDGRAVPILRKYAIAKIEEIKLTNDPKHVDKEKSYEVYTIMSMINQLGGNVDDLVPKDFFNQK